MAVDAALIVLLWPHSTDKKMLEKDDDVNMEDLFGSDDDSTDVKESSKEASAQKKVTVECPRYPRIQSDGKVRSSVLALRAQFETAFLTWRCLSRCTSLA